MTATNTAPLVCQRSQDGDDGLEQHKGPQNSCRSSARVAPRAKRGW
jgi:hypothetical protein